MMEHAAPFVAALLALGMGLAFVWADPRSPTSRALALALVFGGVSIVLDVFFVRPYKTTAVPAWTGMVVLTEVIAFCAAFEWVLRVRRTIPAGTLRTRFGDRALRFAQALVVLYGLLALVFPERRVHGFIGALLDRGALAGFDFYLFAVPLELALLLAGISILLVLNRRPDRAERIRLIAFCVGLPFTAAALVLPPGLASLVFALGLLFLLAGAVRYHVLQGERAVFLSRFLSPQVAELVRRRGLRSVMQDTTLELSVVCCDLRNFTAFAQQTPSNRVMALLREYYDVVGEAASRRAGTIKDYAGDGILILVGAPLALPDHAARALGLAEAIRRDVGELTRRWSDSPDALGVGIGVATGTVSVGVIGGAGRLEYAAVGRAVNLAARLCERAGSSEILVDQATAERSERHSDGFRACQPASLKGVGAAVPYFVLGEAIAEPLATP